MEDFGAEEGFGRVGWVGKRDVEMEAEKAGFVGCAWWAGEENVEGC